MSGQRVFEAACGYRVIGHLLAQTAPVLSWMPQRSVAADADADADADARARDTIEAPELSLDTFDLLLAMAAHASSSQTSSAGADALVLPANMISCDV